MLTHIFIVSNKLSIFNYFEKVQNIKCPKKRVSVTVNNFPQKKTKWRYDLFLLKWLHSLEVLLTRIMDIRGLVYRLVVSWFNVCFPGQIMTSSIAQPSPHTPTGLCGTLGVHRIIHRMVLPVVFVDVDNIVSA